MNRDSNQIVSTAAPARNELAASIPPWIRHARGIATALCGVGLLGGWIAIWLAAPRSIETALFLFAYLTGGFITTREVFDSLRAFRLDINALMLIAALGAGSIGHWDDGAALLFLFSLSNTLEKYAMGRTSRAVQALMEISPPEALLVRDGTERPVPVEQLAVGDLVRVKPGHRIPADGVVVEGQSSVNQAAITGESVPVDVGRGDTVFSGTINEHGALDIRVEKPAAQSALAQIVRVVKTAQSQKAATQRAIERFGEIYAPLVLVLAAAAIALPMWLGHMPFGTAFYRGMILLVAASPCALILATPATTLSAIANGARHGILFKSSNAVEDVSLIQIVAFDKTGTLTQGRHVLTDVVPLGSTDERELLRLAAIAENRSEHPLARAVVGAARGRGIQLDEPAEFDSWPGEGVQVRVGNRIVWVGNDKLLRRMGVSPQADALAAREKLAREGKSVIQAFDRDGVFGLLALADQPRPEARATMEALRRLGLRTLMITGDYETVGRSIAGQIGVAEVHASCSPQQKVDVVRQLAEAGRHVAMVGDDLTSIPYVIELSRKARRVVKQNLIFAVSVIVVLVVLNFTGRLTLPMGVIGHEGSTLLVALNGLRLLKPLQI